MTNQPIARARIAFDKRPDLPVALVVGAGEMSMAIAHRLGQSHRVVLASLRSEELEQGQDRLQESGIVSTHMRLNLMRVCSRLWMRHS